MKPRRTAALALLAAAALLLACGGGDDEATTTGATDATGASGDTLTKQQFITRADEICAAGDEEIISAGRAEFGNQAPQGEELAQFVDDVVVPSTQRQHDQIAALPVPEGEEQSVDQLLTALQQGIDSLESDPEQLVQSSGDDPFEEASRLAREFGLTDCGS